MPSEATINAIWLVSCAVAFFAVSVVFSGLAGRIRRQYAAEKMPLTDLAKALVRQKYAIAVFGLAWTVVVGAAAVASIWGWEPSFWSKMAYRVVALLTIGGFGVGGVLVGRAMDRDARRVAAIVRSDAHRTMKAMERIADQGDATALAGHEDRTATATERTADAAESLTTNHQT